MYTKEQTKPGSIKRQIENLRNLANHLSQYVIHCFTSDLVSVAKDTHQAKDLNLK